MTNSIMAIYGEVSGLVEEKNNETVESYLDEKKSDFNYAKCDLYDISFSQVMEEVLTIPFTLEKRAIVVKNASIFTDEKALRDIQPNNKQANEFLEKYDGENFITSGVYQNKLDKRKKVTKTLKKTSKLAKVEQTPKQEIKKRIKNKLHENLKDVKQDALDLFIELISINFNIVSQELEKIILFLGERPTINKKGIEEIINESLEQNVFPLTEYTQKGEKYKAIQLIKSLIIMKGEPIKLLALITDNYRLYYQCEILSRRGYSG